MSWPKLSHDRRKSFFGTYASLEEIKAAYKRKSLDDFCVENISWCDWEYQCCINKMQYQVSRLPEMCYDHMLSAEQEEQLIDFLDYLLTEKTTKTFEDLL